MSLDTLKNDLKLNLAEVSKLGVEIGATTETGAKIDILVNHLAGNLWPTLEAIVDELDEVDGVVADIVSGAEDILQPETAAVFAAVIASSTTIAAALKLRINKEADAQLYRVVEELEQNLRQATEIMEEIVIDDGEGLDDDDDDDDQDEEEENA